MYDFAPESENLFGIDHAHKFMELLVIHSGSGAIILENTAQIELGRGSVVFINKGVMHRLESRSTAKFNAFFVSFVVTPRITTEKIPHEWIDDEKVIITKILNSAFQYVQDNGDCIQALDSVVCSAKTRNVGELVIVKNFMSNLLMSAFQAFARLPQRSDFDNVLHKAPSRNSSRIVKYICDQFREDITLASVSESLFYSPRQCQRIIMDNLRMSFSDYLIDLRLAHAKKLLLNTDLCIEMIAEDTGFKNRRNFSRLFAAHEGITPYRYRKEHEGTVGKQNMQ